MQNTINNTKKSVDTLSDMEEVESIGVPDMEKNLYTLESSIATIDERIPQTSEFEVYNNDDIVGNKSAGKEIEINEAEDVDMIQTTVDVDSGQFHKNGSTELQSEDQSKTDTELINKIIQLPQSRIRSLMKLDQQVVAPSKEAVFLITKATELFVQRLAQDAYTATAESKKKTVKKIDLESAVSANGCYIFLEDSMYF